MQTVEATRIVPQTVVVTRITTQLVPLLITTTPIPTGTPTPRWTPSFTDTSVYILSLTPGLEIINNDTRPDVEKFVLAQYIKDDLALNYGIHIFWGKVFCGYQPMGMENDGQTVKLFLWILCSEFYVSDQTLERGTLMSEPVVLLIEVRHGNYRIVDIIDAGDGYQLVKVNFPPKIQNIIVNLYHDTNPESFNNGVGALLHEVEQEAKAYYGF